MSFNVNYYKIMIYLTLFIQDTILTVSIILKISKIVAILKNIGLTLVQELLIMFFLSRICSSNVELSSRKNDLIRLGLIT